MAFIEHKCDGKSAVEIEEEIRFLRHRFKSEVDDLEKKLKRSILENKS